LPSVADKGAERLKIRRVLIYHCYFSLDSVATGGHAWLYRCAGSEQHQSHSNDLSSDPRTNRCAIVSSPA
jgi:hypothetical protein